MRKQLLSLSIVFLFLLSVNGISAVVTDVDVDPILVIGSEGTGNGKFNEPDAVFVASNGLIYVGDTDNLRIQVFDGEGNYLRELTGFTGHDVDSNNEPQGIGELTSGTIVATEKSGNVFFFDSSDGSLIKKVDLNITFSGGVDTQGLVVDTTTDDIYISNQPESLVYILDVTGAYIGNFSTGFLGSPENMVIDNDVNKIYVSIENGGKIRSYDLDTYALIDEFGAETSTTNFEGLAIDPLGNILAANEGPDSINGNDPVNIVIFDKTNFTAIYAWGDITPGTEEGQFHSPDGLAYDFMRNRVLISDQGNYRVQVFDYIDIIVSNGIYSDGTAPTVSAPADITMTVGDDETVSWTITEALFGGTYELLMDSVAVKDAYTSEGSNVVDYSLSELAVGTYVFDLDVEDAFGNTASDVVTVTVEDIATSSTPTDTADTPIPVFVIPLGLSAMVILRKKR